MEQSKIIDMLETYQRPHLPKAAAPVQRPPLLFPATPLFLALVRLLSLPLPRPGAAIPGSPAWLLPLGDSASARASVPLPDPVSGAMLRARELPNPDIVFGSVDLKKGSSCLL